MSTRSHAARGRHVYWLLGVDLFVMLPKRRPEPVYDPDQPEGAPVPVLAGH